MGAGAVAGGVALAEAASAAAAPASPAATAPGTMSFADAAPTADPAQAIIDEVIGDGTAPAAEGDAADAPADGDKPTDGEPAAAAKAAEPAKDEPPVNDVEAARLRKGFAKLAEERQRLVELQNTARAATATAQQYAEKARKHDEMTAAVDSDPAAFLLARGGEALVQKALKGFIDMEKSPAEREIAKVREELADRDAKETQRRQEQDAANWRNGIVAKVQSDERFDLVNSLGLHGDVIAVMTGYYEKHSERDDKGNVTKPAILPWDTAAQAVEETRAAMLDKSKRYGKRTPAAAEGATPPAKKDAPPAKPAAAPAKKAPTSLSSVPVADTPLLEDDLPTDDLDARQAQLLAQMGL